MVFCAGLCLFPIYFLMGVGLVFNDSGNKAASFMEFISSLGFIFLIYFGALILAYIMLRRFKCNNLILNFLFIPINLIIFGLIFCLFMQVYLDPKIDEKINPITIHSMKNEKKEIEKLTLTQEEDFDKYQTEREQYERIHSFKTDDGYFEFMLNKNSNSLYVVHQGDSNIVFRQIPAADYLAVERSKVSTADLNINSSLSPKLIVGMEQFHEDYITIPKLALAFKISSDEKVALSNELLTFNKFVVGHISSNINSHNITFKGGTVFRTGSIGEDIEWSFKRDGVQILSRVATNETSLDLSTLNEEFRKAGVYSAYVSGGERKLSNTVQWVIKKSDSK